MLLKSRTCYQKSFQVCERNNHGNAYVYNNNRQIYLIDNQLELQQKGIFKEAVLLGWGKVSFHPEKEQVAGLTETAVIVTDFKENILWQNAKKCSYVLYSRDGKLIWTAEKLDKHQICISAFDSQNGDIINSLLIEDELYDSAPRLTDIPNSDMVTLELAAGQDGILVSRLTLTDNQVILNQPLTDSSYITPAWRPDGTRFFTLENDELTFAHFQMGDDIQLIKAQDEPDLDEEDLSPSYNLLYLKNGMILTQNINDRHFLFDSENMERGEEVIFEGYEPVPVCQVFKNLKDDDSLYSRITYVQRIGNVIVARTSERTEQPVLLLFDEDDFIRQLEETF